MPPRCIQKSRPTRVSFRRTCRPCATSPATSRSCPARAPRSRTRRRRWWKPRVRCARTSTCWRPRRPLPSPATPRSAPGSSRCCPGRTIGDICADPPTKSPRLRSFTAAMPEGSHPAETRTRKEGTMKTSHWMIAALLIAPAVARADRAERLERRAERMERRGERKEKRGEKLEAVGDKVEQKGEAKEQRGQGLVEQGKVKQGDALERAGQRQERAGERIEKRGDGLERRGERREKRGEALEHEASAAAPHE